MEIYEKTMRLYYIFLGNSHINCLNFQFILKLWLEVTFNKGWGNRDDSILVD